MSSELSFIRQNLKVLINIYAVNKGSHAENKASHGGKQRFFSNVPNSLVFYYTLFRKPNSCVQRRSEINLEVCFCFVSLFVEGGRGGG